jgi:hypothetical protein
MMITNLKDAMYKLIVFRGVKAGSDFLRSGVARPLALIVRLGSGKLVEIDLGLKEEAGAITPAVQRLIPPSSSAVILTAADLEALDERLGPWEHVVHSF